MNELNTQTKQTLEVGYTYSFLPKEKITNKNRGIEISIYSWSIDGGGVRDL